VSARAAIALVAILAACSSRSAPSGDGGGRDRPVAEVGRDRFVPELTLDVPYSKTCPAYPTEAAGCPKGCTWIAWVPASGPPFLCAQPCGGGESCPDGQGCSNGFCMHTCADDYSCGGMWESFFWCNKSKQVCTWGPKPDAGADSKQQ
jgi:hypothetical protein